MKTRLPALLLAAAFAAPASAGEEPVVVWNHHQILAAAEAGRDMADAWKRWADDFSREMRSSMSLMYAPRMSGKVVKGAPYSAEIVTETNQALADGNVISRRKTSLVFRDSEGRVRQETGAEARTQSIHISDPVEKKHYILDPGAKSAVVVPRAAPAPMAHAPGAHERHVNRHVIRVSGTEVRIENGKVFVDGKEAAPGRVEVTSNSGKKVVVEDGRVTIDGKEVGHYSGGGGTTVNVQRHEGADGLKREEVRVQVIRAGDDKLIPAPPVPPMPPMPGAAPMPPTPPMPPMPGVHTMRFESTAKLGKGVTTSLGTRDFDGVKAEGKSTVWTIAAGEIGNRSPINITSETWYSPELQVTVYSRYNDPRTGESIYRLANIRRAEPAAELFRVPDDYRTKGRHGRG